MVSLRYHFAALSPQYRYATALVTANVASRVTAIAALRIPIFDFDGTYGPSA